MICRYSVLYHINKTLNYLHDCDCDFIEEKKSPIICQ